MLKIHLLPILCIAALTGAFVVGAYSQISLKPIILKESLQAPLDPSRSSLPPFQSGDPNAILDGILDSVFRANPVKGITAAVILPDGRVWKGARGIASQVPNDSLSSSDLMGMGSISKSFTAAAIFKLVEAGKLSLDDTLGSYLPPWRNINRKITLRQLLNHTSGLNNYTDNPQFWNQVNLNLSKVFEPEEILANFVLAPLFSPGARWSYSNTNYLIAHYLIEKVSGKSYAAFIRENLLDPAGLLHTYVYPWESPREKVAHLFYDIDGNGSLDDWQAAGLSLQGIFSGAGGAGCLMTDATDLAKWMRALSSGQILTESSWKEMTAAVNISTGRPTTGPGYGGGVIISYFMGKPYYGHDGNIFYQSVCFHFPGCGYTFAVQTNDAADQRALSAFTNTAVLALCREGSTSLDILRDASWSLAPNPVREKLMISGLKPGQRMQLLDLQGRPRIAFTADEEEEWLDVRDVPAGLYFLSSEGRTEKLLVQH